ANGPTRLGPLARAVSAASTMVRVEGPPDPMMMPVRGLTTSDGSSPASRIACSMATWFQAAPPPRNRMARRSTDSVGSSVGAPCTWLRKPSSTCLSAREIPDFASRRLASTSWVLLPIDETIPIPVTTTRLMNASSASRPAQRAQPPSSPAARLHHFVAEQSDLEVYGAIDDRPVGREPAVGDAQHELAAHDPLDVDAVDHLLDRGQDLAGEFQLAEPERTSPARRAEPTQEEAQQLPQHIEAQAAGTARIAFEMAGKEPQVRLEIEHSTNQAFPVLAAGFCDLGDAIEHEHGGQRQLGIAGAEQLAACAG